MLQTRGGPYAPTTAGLGGTPSKKLDDPITAVFLFLFLLGAIAHMTILQRNNRRKKKFLISGMLFGFCMARITATTMRLVWSTHPRSIPIAIAAQVFVFAGVLLLFVINLIFTQRVYRASFSWAWSKWFSLAFKLYYASIVAAIIILITCTVQSFYTLNTNIRRIDHDVSLFGATYFTVASFLTLLLNLLRFVLPYKYEHVENFGEGRFRTKILILLPTSTFLTLGAAFRAGIQYKPRPIAHPAWYDSKACFYLFNFTIEILVVYFYAIIRVDRIFHVPNGCHAPGDYSGKNVSSDKPERGASWSDRVHDEEQGMSHENAGNGPADRVTEKPGEGLEDGVSAVANHAQAG